jgi:hypothetical protein
MYQLDAKAAKESDNIGAYLSETGKYVGKFTRAEMLKSKNTQTDGVGFTFVSDTGQSTRFDLWTVKANGEQLSGYKALMAIMACMKQRSLTPTKQEVERQDYNTKERYKEIVDVFPELMNKPIGLLLRSTEYEKMKDGQFTGQTGWRLEMFGAFEADTEFTAGEIMDKKTKPEQLAKMVAMLADRPLKKSASRGASSASGGHQGRTLADMDDDIPF